MRFLFVLVLLALCLSSCAKPPIDSYDTSCTVADDCAFVSTSESCDCRCANIAINADEVERFNREQAPFCPIPSGVECLCAIPGPLECADELCAVQGEET